MYFICPVYCCINSRHEVTCSGSEPSINFTVMVDTLLEYDPRLYHPRLSFKVFRVIVNEEPFARVLFDGTLHEVQTFGVPE